MLSIIKLWAECVSPHLRCLRAIGFCRLPATTRYRVAHSYYRVYTLLLTTTYMSQQLLHAYQKQPNVEKICEVLFIALCHITCMAKQLVFLGRAAGVEALVAALGEVGGPPAGEGAARRLADTARSAARLLYVYSGCAFATCVLWTIIPVILRLRGEHFEFPFWTFVDYEHPAKFSAVLAYSFYCSILVAVGNTTIDAFIAAVLRHCHTHFTILQSNMESLEHRARAASERPGQPYGAALRRRLAGCVRHHQQIVEIHDQLLELFGDALLVQFAAAGWILCMAAYRIVTLNVFSIEFASMTMFLSCIFTELLLFCYCGNEITVASERMLGSIYGMQWSRTPVEFQRALVVAMQRAQRPLRPAAGRVVPLSLDTFLKILKSAYSLYALLRQTN